MGWRWSRRLRQRGLLQGNVFHFIWLGKGQEWEAMSVLLQTLIKGTTISSDLRSLSGHKTHFPIPPNVLTLPLPPHPFVFDLL
ncbi:unnamed protein product [Sphenostylis stenocarpa]|uniref:Uncharacterized protein n=1 Tax=Sphenostylis stenocarpa TaxID=92480 RepID=A0AA86SGF2_9FABA|nr:unnamed protein product [Sphenostylis stenocarpa]